MSIRCGINVRQAKRYNGYMRDVQRQHDDARFYADLGEEPISKQRAFELGLDGPHIESRTYLNPVDARLVQRAARRHWEPNWGVNFVDDDTWLRQQRKRYVTVHIEPALPVDAIRDFDLGRDQYEVWAENELRMFRAEAAERFGFTD